MPAAGDGSALGSPVSAGLAGDFRSPLSVAPAGLLSAPAAAGAGAAPSRSAPALQLRAAGLSGGGCFARPLPADLTCAAAARRHFREAVAALGLPAGLVHDGVTMASELAANTLHAQRNVAGGKGRSRSVAGIPEIWLYLRGSGLGRELVCKVFDTERGWNAGVAPGMTRAPEDSVNGRGLQVVAGLSAGQWGCHLSRSRLGSWRVPGKAVWFSLRIPPGALPALAGLPRHSPDLLTDELEAMLADRGLAAGMMRAESGAAAVLSLSRHLTVWRLGDRVRWRSVTGFYQQADLADLVEVTEQVVCAHEESEQADLAGQRPE